MEVVEQQQINNLDTPRNIIFGKYEMGRLLGKGTFAKVYHGRNLVTGESVAIKVVLKDRVVKKDGPNLMNQIKREISIMSMVHHPHIVELKEVMATRCKVFFIMEYVKGGELFTKVAKGRLSEDLARKYFQQLISAVDFCHSRGVCHRDLKPENLLLDENEDLKVSDFGLSALPEQLRKDGMLYTQCGTPAYVAPEVLKKLGYDGAKADIWSCGIILFVLLAGYLPFHDENVMKLYKKAFEAQYQFPDWISEEAKSLISKLLVVDPNKRISISEILKNPWFQIGYTKPIASSIEEGEKGENSSNTEEWELMSTKSSPPFYNAFDFISSMSAGFDLSSLFEKKRKSAALFTSKCSASTILKKLEAVAKKVNFRMMWDKDFKVKMQGKMEGRKGKLGVTVEVFEVVPEMAVVEFSKSSGDTLEYNKFYEEEVRPALKDIVWSWQAAFKNMAVTGSNSQQQPQFIAITGNQSYTNEPLIENSETNQIVVPEKKSSWRKLLAYMGPGFLVSIAYIDPGNFETDLQSGAQFKYGLLWIILVASCAALIIQSLAANLGVVTGKHLAEHCRIEYPRVTNFILWLLAEISIVACDIPEVIGTAFALNMLFNIPLWCGVLLTGFSTLVLLALQQYGVRKLEFFIAFLVATIALCFFVELGYAKPVFSEVMYGLFVPQLKGNGATGLAISLLGAMVMPHNLFLHSALVLSRKIPRSSGGIKEACRYYMMESGFALAIAFCINISVISVSGAVCNSSNMSVEDQNSCKDLDLNKASFLLRNVLGRWSSKLFAIALLASGQSSTITGTYAGQYVMQGFLDLRLKPWIRNFLTRCLAIVPSLIVALIGGSSGAGKLIIIASMILSFELPFALIPLLKFTSCETKMGTYVNSTMITTTTWIIGSLIMAINIYYIMTGFMNLLLHSHLKLVNILFCGIFGFTGMAIYLGGISYLVFRKNKETTNLIALSSTTECRQREQNEHTNITSMYTLPREDIVNMQLPQRSSTGDLD